MKRALIACLVGTLLIAAASCRDPAAPSPPESPSEPGEDVPTALVPGT